MKILDIESATLYRGSTKVFDNVDISVASGQNTAIVGPNGAGKSTLLKVLAREIYPAAGLVSLFGKSRWNVWELRKRLGIVSAELQQNYSPIAKGFDVVLSGYYASSDIFGHQTFSDEQVSLAKHISEQVGIDSLSQKPFSQMSTGEQRRHLLARALVNQPEALVLDEPTSGLDIPAMFHYLTTIRNLMDRGVTVVLVTHHIHEIPPEVENVILIKEGNVTAQGPKPKILTEENLAELFDVPLQVVETNGYFQVFPTQA